MTASTSVLHPPRPLAGPLPPVGPAWYPAAMGTGILANLLQVHASRIPLAGTLAPAVLALAWAVLATLTGGFLRRIARDRRALIVTLVDTAQAPMWGTVAMGFLAVGSATATVLPAQWPRYTAAAWTADAALWCLGTVVGVPAALGFAIRLIGADRGAPTAVWGLAVVGPMVSATTGAALVPHVPGGLRVWLITVTAACFFLSLFLGTAVFACAYHHHWRVAPVPLAASCSAWIPLGMVGQSTAAAQAIAAQARTVLLPGAQTAAQHIANAYGWTMVVAGIPLVAWAVAVTARGFRRQMPFSPGWWALTFPVGTLALGATLLGGGAGVPELRWVGAAGTLVLLGTVTLCALASVRAVAARGLAG